jgi:hypothetical protein
MDLGTIANVATAAAVLVGLVFGIIEVERGRRERAERAALEVVHAMMTPEWIGTVQLLAAPEALPAVSLEADAELLKAARSVVVILETLGYSVFLRVVPLHVVDELMGGVVRISWRKLKPWVEHERARSGSQKTWEWFQWLAERLDEHGGRITSLAVGAQQAFRNWRP